MLRRISSSGFLVLSLGAILLMPMVLTARMQADTSVVGTWQGALEVGGTKLKVVFHIARTDSGTLAGTLDSPDQGAMGIPLGKITLTCDSITIAIPAVGGGYAGRFTGDRSSISGDWSQLGGRAPLRLDRLSPTAEVEMKRPQEPVPPYPYKEEEVSYENERQGNKLSGTLTLPDSGAPFPAVILITGSGPENRDEEIFGHRPFLVIADYLTRRGIAVLRADDRGVGGSTGGRWDSYTTADYATDVVSGIEYLKGRKDIDPKRIGLVGHSEGGIIGPMVAAQSKDVAFVVMLAGTGYRGDRIIVEQMKLEEEVDGVPAAKVERDARQFEKEISIVESGADSSAIAGQLRDYLSSTYSEWGAEFKKNGVDSTKVIEAQIQSLNSAWFRYFLTYDPARTLERVKCPVLAMDGTLDLQVPGKENLDAIEKALKRGGNKDYTIKLMPGLNHLFQDAKTGSEKEYAQIEETFSPAALKVMGDWIVEKTRRK
jgi:pimeloyl-ACP methyl ester carboxylesterase